MLAGGTLRGVLRHPDPPLGDDVITLRAKTRDDADALVRICQDPAIPRWTRVPVPYRRRDAAAWIAVSELDLAAGTGIDWLAVDEHDEVLASIAIQHIPPSRASARSATGSRRRPAAAASPPAPSASPPSGASGSSACASSRSCPTRTTEPPRASRAPPATSATARPTCRRARGCRPAATCASREAPVEPLEQRRDQSRVDDVGDVGLAVGDVGARGPRARSRAWRPRSIEMTGSSVPWVMATGKPPSPWSWSSKSGTLGMKPLMASSPAGRGRSGPSAERPCHHRALREAAEHGLPDRHAGALRQPLEPQAEALERGREALGSG